VIEELNCHSARGSIKPKCIGELRKEGTDDSRTVDSPDVRCRRSRSTIRHLGSSNSNVCLKIPPPFHTMAYKSPLPTPERTPRRPQIVEASSPWSEVPEKKYGGAKHGTFRTPSRNLNRLFWLTILLMMGVWWVVWLGKVGRAISEDDEYYNKLASQQLRHDGLQFIDATHPFIRVCSLSPEPFCH